MGSQSEFASMRGAQNQYEKLANLRGAACAPSWARALNGGRQGGTGKAGVVIRQPERGHLQWIRPPNEDKIEVLLLWLNVLKTLDVR
jgi:hypothetical protein